MGSRAKFLKWHIRGFLFFFFNGDSPVSFVFVFLNVVRRCFLNVVRRIGKLSRRN